MKHITEYNGIVKRYYDFTCPTCGWHKRFSLDGDDFVNLNSGDVTAEHSGSTIPMLSIDNVQVTQDNPRLDPFEQWADETEI